MTENILETTVQLDELLTLNQTVRVEVIDGKVMKMHPVGGVHHFIAGNIFRLLDGHVNTNELGYVFMDGLLYLLFRSGTGIKGAQVPDVSFISREDMSKTWDVEKPYPGAPTLAVEVVSPGDDADHLLSRIRHYLDAGTREVWVIYPKTQELHVHTPTHDNIAIFKKDTTLSSEAILPGLSLPLKRIFKIPNLK